MAGLHVSVSCFILSLLCISAIVEAKKKEADVTELQIGTKYKPEICELVARKGDFVSVHYNASLVDGTEYESSYSTGHPIHFELLAGHVIKGLDQGILGMCVGERRKLKIPPKLGFGAEGSPQKFQASDATLVFYTELTAVNGRTEPPKTEL